MNPITSQYAKCGTVTVSIYKESFNRNMAFRIEADSDDALPVSYVIEDTLKMY